LSVISVHLDYREVVVVLLRIKDEPFKPFYYISYKDAQPAKDLEYDEEACSEMPW
jgi:hypothetical protein